MSYATGVPPVVGFKLDQTLSNPSYQGQPAVPPVTVCGFRAGPPSYSSESPRSHHPNPLDCPFKCTLPAAIKHLFKTHSHQTPQDAPRSPSRPPADGDMRHAKRVLSAGVRPQRRNGSSRGREKTRQCDLGGADAALPRRCRSLARPFSSTRPAHTDPSQEGRTPRCVAAPQPGGRRGPPRLRARRRRAPSRGGHDPTKRGCGPTDRRRPEKVAGSTRPNGRAETDSCGESPRRWRFCSFASADIQARNDSRQRRDVELRGHRSVVPDGSSR